MKVIFIFVDGLGIGADNPEINPLSGGRFPVLEHMIARSIPLDATLGVPGLPQSATGQASLLTGINTPKAMGRHIEGFPPPSLKKLVQDENLFHKLARIGRSCTFANCYLNVDANHIPPRRQSVTTVATLAALGKVRGTSDLLEGKAVTHDITRHTMHSRGYEAEPISPELAAKHLRSIAEEYDFTLFEYFLTDRAGHSGDMPSALECLGILERFIAPMLPFEEHPDHLLLLSSDHGNIEDLSVRTHTMNPVPLVATGTCAETFSSTQNLCDVVPAILALYRS